MLGAKIFDDQSGPSIILGRYYDPIFLLLLLLYSPPCDYKPMVLSQAGFKHPNALEGNFLHRSVFLEFSV